MGDGHATHRRLVAHGDLTGGHQTGDVGQSQDTGWDDFFRCALFYAAGCFEGPPSYPLPEHHRPAVQGTQSVNPRLRIYRYTKGGKDYRKEHPLEDSNHIFLLPVGREAPLLGSPAQNEGKVPRVTRVHQSTGVY